MKKSRKRIVLILSISAAVMMILTGTFAFITSSNSVKNRLETDAGANNTPDSVFITEIFDERAAKEWKPGQDITKQVAVTNAGEGDVMVRLSFEEVLKLINLPAISVPTAFNAAAEASGQIPVETDASAYSSWTEVTEAPISGVSAELDGLKLAAAYPGVKVFANAKEVDSAITYEFIYYSEISGGTTYDGLCQQVTAEKDFHNVTKILTLKDIKFYVFDGKTTNTTDWKTVKPLTANTLQSQLDSNIILYYGPAMNGGSGSYTKGSWFYNEADGYFYYLDKLAAGTTTVHMLASVQLDGSAGSEYAYMEYDLTVNLESVQNTKGAVIAEWGLADGSPLLTALEAYFEA